MFVFACGSTLIVSFLVLGLFASLRCTLPRRHIALCRNETVSNLIHSFLAFIHTDALAPTLRLA